MLPASAFGDLGVASAAQRVATGRSQAGVASVVQAGYPANGIWRGGSYLLLAAAE
jgi:hypothetical protein